MPKKDKNEVRVSPREDWRAVQSSNTDRAYRVVDTKKEAEQLWRDLAKNKQAELIIQKKDGTIQNKNSFWNDPTPPKDRK